ncbi:hypothetical protein [Salinactinospora qingdaonensis]|uniref:CRISPR-associated protein, APE2256 family n=1 Tax=Salinactinospora qingdaonensis TaxID=702744 RepID=A0ABP7F6G3_9ACTN
MTTHLISVGLTLRDNLGSDPAAHLDGDHDDALDALHELLPTLLPDSGDTAVHRERLRRELTPAGDAATALEDQISRVRPELWTSRASAELATFARHSDQRPAAPPKHAHLDKKDTVVLLTTDTVAGLRAGLWNALALTAGQRDRVRYLPHPEEADRHARGEVVIAAVPGLDAADDADMTRAMRHLGMLGRMLIDHIAGPGADYVFHLSGGYKAAIPYLIGLAEGMRGLIHRDREVKREVKSVHAYVLHESNTSRLIRLPLRTLPYEVIRNELADVDPDDTPTDGRGRRLLQPPAHRLLEGYAYEPDRRGWRLTPFGEGLLALIH